MTLAPTDQPERTRARERSEAGLVIEPRRTGLLPRLQETWGARDLAGFFGRRFLLKMYARTKLGRLWIPLRPVLDVGSRALIFGGLLAAPSNGKPYILFFLVGMTVWNFFEKLIIWATRSIELNRKLVTKLYFPRLILPVAAWMPALVDLAIYCVLLALTVLAYLAIDGTTYLEVGVHSWQIAAGMALMSAIAFGIGLLLAPFGARGRDARFGVMYATGFWFFLTPVIYPLSALDGTGRTLALLNPVTAPMELVRDGLLGVGEVPALALASSIVGAGTALAVGLWYFSKAEAASIDHL